MYDLTFKEEPKDLAKKRDSLKEETKAKYDNYIKQDREFKATRTELFNANVDIAKVQVEEVLNMEYWAFHDRIMENEELNTKRTLELYYLAIVRSIGKELLLLNFLQNDGSTFISSSELPRTFEDMVKYLHDIENDF